MKRLFLLRHAQALPASGTTDIERKLSPKGEGDAVALGQAMVKKGYVPDLVYCSPAVRTRMTLECLRQSLDLPNVEYEQALYDGDIADYLKLVYKTDDSVQNILIVGHNPVVHAVAAQLAKEDDSPFLSKLMSHYEPATLSVFDYDGASWVMIRDYQNPLSDLLEPMDYNDPGRPTRWM